MDSYIVVIVLILRINLGQSSYQIQTLFKQREGEYLANSVIRTEQTGGIFECGSLCARENDCMSVNYKKSGGNRGLCELNNSTLDNSKRENRKKVPAFINLWILKSVSQSTFKKKFLNPRRPNHFPHGRVKSSGVRQSKKNELSQWVRRG